MTTQNKDGMDTKFVSKHGIGTMHVKRLIGTTANDTEVSRHAFTEVSRHAFTGEMAQVGTPCLQATWPLTLQPLLPEEVVRLLSALLYSTWFTLPAKQGGSENEPSASFPGRAMSNAVNVEPLTLRPSPAKLALADPPQTSFGEGEPSPTWTIQQLKSRTTSKDGERGRTFGCSASLVALAPSILICLAVVANTCYAQSGSLYLNPNNVADVRGTWPQQPAEQLPAPDRRADPSFAVLPPTGGPWDANSNLLAASWTAQPPVPARNLKIHDIISIRVDETATTNAQGNAQSRKTTLYDARLNDWFELVGWDTVKPAKQPDGDPRAQSQQNEVYRGSSTLQTREQVTLNIAAEIADIRPNGTLVLSAQESIEINDNTWLVSLSGICRPQDVGPDNVVLSRNIFELKVRKQELGHVRDGYSRGWFTRWLARFKPF